MKTDLQIEFKESNVLIYIILEIKNRKYFYKIPIYIYRVINGDHMGR